jgi:hypothetical protein
VRHITLSGLCHSEVGSGPSGARPLVALLGVTARRTASILHKSVIFLTLGPAISTVWFIDTCLVPSLPRLPQLRGEQL